MSAPEEYPKEETDNQSPKTILSPEEVREYEKAKEELFIYLFRKRETYYKRWQKVTGKYFACLELNPWNKEELAKHDTDIEDVIQRYDNRTMRRRKEFAEKYSFNLAEDGYFPFLHGLDYLVKPRTLEEREALNRKHREYCAKNDEINPSTPVYKPEEQTEEYEGIEAEEAVSDQDSPWEGSVSSSASETEN